AELRDNSTRIALELAHYVSLNARAEAESLARSPSFAQHYEDGDGSRLLEEIRTHRITLQGGFAIVYRDGTPVAQYQSPQSSQLAMVRAWVDDDDGSKNKFADFTAAALTAAQRTDEPILAVGNNQYAVGDATIDSGGLVVVGLPMPAGLSFTVEQIR